MNGWVSLGVGLAACAILVVQVTLVVRNRLRLRGWKKTEGRAMATRVSRSAWYGQYSSSYLATYSYLADNGRSYIGHASVDRNLPSGSRLEILYAPDEPERSQPVRRMSAAHIGPAVLGVLFFLAGLYGVVNGILTLTTGTGVE